MTTRSHGAFFDSGSGTRPKGGIALARAQVSRQLSRRLPYYLTPEEAHQLIDAAENERDRLFLRLLWETGARVSEAIAVRLGDVGRDSIRILGKGPKGKGHLHTGQSGGIHPFMGPGEGPEQG